MASIITQNGFLTGTGVIYEANVKYYNTVDLTVEDNGGGSTITVETSPDDSTWTAATGVYNIGTGALVQQSGGTFTAKGKYVIDTQNIAYLRIRVSTYVSGTIITRFEESPVSLKGLIGNMLVTGLVAQGTTQANAFPLAGTFNVFATVAASSGAVLPTGVNRNGDIKIKNGGANTLTVYPPLGGAINGGTVNAGVSVAAAGVGAFVSDGLGNFWQF